MVRKAKKGISGRKKKNAKKASKTKSIPKKTELMVKFERKTKKHAIWHGKITENFKEWKKDQGKKVSKPLVTKQIIKEETWWERHKREAKKNPDLERIWDDYWNEQKEQAIAGSNFARLEWLKRKTEFKNRPKPKPHTSKWWDKHKKKFPQEYKKIEPTKKPKSIAKTPQEKSWWEKHKEKVKQIEEESQKTKHVFNTLKIRKVSKPEHISLFHQLFKKKKEKAKKEKVEKTIINNIVKSEQKKEVPKKLFGIIKLNPAKEPIKKIMMAGTDIAKKIVIETIMSKNPIYVEINDSIEHVLEYLVKYDVRGVPVKEHGKFFGTIEEKDLMNFFKNKFEMTEGALRLHKKDIEELGKNKVRTLLTKRSPTLSPKDSLEKAIKIMQQHDVNRIAVLEKDRLVGIVTRDDVVKAIVKSSISLEAITSQVVRTDIDKLHELVEANGRISTEDAATNLKIEKSLIEEWASILEEHKLITVEYPLAGTIELVKKEE